MKENYRIDVRTIQYLYSCIISYHVMWFFSLREYNNNGERCTPVFIINGLKKKNSNNCSSNWKRSCKYKGQSNENGLYATKHNRTIITSKVISKLFIHLSHCDTRRSIPFLKDLMGYLPNQFFTKPQTSSVDAMNRPRMSFLNRYSFISLYPSDHQSHQK